VSSQAFYLTLPTGSLGQRFCVFHPAGGAVMRGAVVFVHPFAEEMNRSRRMAALQARAFAANGFAVLQMDLLGCGDSSGDFNDACWEAWVADVRQAVEWLAQRAGGPLWLWGLRAGCLLAAEAAAELDRAVNLLFWQPATSGKLLLQQFLRQRLAADLVSGSAKGAISVLRHELATQGRLEVSGYALGIDLANGLEGAALRPVQSVLAVHWLELTQHPSDAEMSPAAMRSIADWRSAGVQVFESVIRGPMFWQTVEIEDAPELLVASCAALLAGNSQYWPWNRPLDLNAKARR